MAAPDEVEQKPCPNSGKFPWGHGPAKPPHTCPFSDEMAGGDSKTECECCETCEGECAMDI